MESRFTLNPFKNLIRTPVVYFILDEKSQKVIHKVFCIEKEEKKKFKEMLEEFNKKGIIKLKKHKTWLQNLHGYSKYTELNGEVIPIIEYEFSPHDKNEKR